MNPSIASRPLRGARHRCVVGGAVRRLPALDGGAAARSSGRLWESNRNKLLLAPLASAPVVVYLLASHARRRRDAAAHRRSTTSRSSALLGALFAISGGICVRGSLTGTPLVNTALPRRSGPCSGSVVGTTGASALLIRPLLRANEHARRHDAPRRLLHLRRLEQRRPADAARRSAAVPRLPARRAVRLDVPPAAGLGARQRRPARRCSPVFDWLVVDHRASAAPARRRSLQPLAPREPLRIDGGLNLVWLLGIVGVVFLAGTFGPRLIPNAELPFGGAGARDDRASRVCPGSRPRTDVRAGEPLHAGRRSSRSRSVFAGIFVTMIPALVVPRGARRGARDHEALAVLLGVGRAVERPRQRADLPDVRVARDRRRRSGGAGVCCRPRTSAGWPSHPVGQHLLAAISCGAVLMGAVTYIGNGPNFMVKAIAEQHHVRMPSFFGYIVWSAAVLLPLFAVVTRIFF